MNDGEAGETWDNQSQKREGGHRVEPARFIVINSNET